MEKNSTKTIQDICLKLLNAYKSGHLGDMTMPEDTHPHFSDLEVRIAYFTLPMALNYQRNSYKLWESAKRTFEDEQTRDVFDLQKVTALSFQELQTKLAKYKLMLQPNKHTNTWVTIASSVYTNYETFENLFETNEYDFLNLRETIQKNLKKGFPYLSGPKIFNYWSFMISDSRYGKINLVNKEYIEIAPDTHIIKCSVKLGVITQEESKKLTRDQIAERWRNLLKGSEITPIEMHAPLWFWSKNDFSYKLRISD